MQTLKSTKTLLDKQYDIWHTGNFKDQDPISIPHRFKLKEDIEIAAFLTALIAWGNRKSIISSAEKMMTLLDNSPHQFILQHQSIDLKPLSRFVHRTFNGEDFISLLSFLNLAYTQYNGLENCFSMHLNPKDLSVENALNGFKQLYVNSEAHLKRTEKHIASPAQGSACKRLNMFLRWMVRHDAKGIDFGLWKTIKTSQLICPLDVHVIRQALKLKLLKTDKSNWNNALELTNALKKFCPNDPVKYDFALFGLGIQETLQNKAKISLR